MDWRQVEFRNPEPAPVPVWRNQRYWRWVVGAVALLVALAVLLRQPLSEWLWSGSRLQALLEQGDVALRAGKLSVADGSGAREKFEAAQALDNDRSEATAGLARVAHAALGQARAAIAAEDYPRASQMLALARELQAPAAQTAALADELRRRQAARSGLGQWLQAARLAADEGRLEGGEGAALPLYRRVLALQPDNTEALEGREDALTDLLQQADKALKVGDLAQGAALVAAVEGYDAGHVDLPALRAALSQALERQRQRADALLRQQRLPQALAAYRSMQVDDKTPANPDIAARGIERVAMAYAAQSRKLAADFKFDQATAALQQAQALAPAASEVRQAAQYLQRVRQEQAQREVAISTQARRRVGQLLEEMRKAEARGDWGTPPGDSAYDKLRAAQALGPREPLVVAASQRLLPSVRRCFEDELKANRPRAASACLDAWANLAPDQAELSSARRRLALKWIAVGNERLGAGDLDYAREALRQAGLLDAKVAGLGELRERLAGARSP